MKVIFDSEIQNRSPWRYKISPFILLSIYQASVLVNLLQSWLDRHSLIQLSSLLRKLPFVFCPYCNLNIGTLVATVKFVCLWWREIANLHSIRWEKYQIAFWLGLHPLHYENRVYFPSRLKNSYFQSTEFNSNLNTKWIVTQLVVPSLRPSHFSSNAYHLLQIIVCQVISWRTI